VGLPGRSSSGLKTKNVLWFSNWVSPRVRREIKRKKRQSYGKKEKCRDKTLFEEQAGRRGKLLGLEKEHVLMWGKNVSARGRGGKENLSGLGWKECC